MKVPFWGCVGLLGAGNFDPEVRGEVARRAVRHYEVHHQEVGENPHDLPLPFPPGVEMKRGDDNEKRPRFGGPTVGTTTGTADSVVPEPEWPETTSDFCETLPTYPQTLQHDPEWNTTYAR